MTVEAGVAEGFCGDAGLAAAGVGSPGFVRTSPEKSGVGMESAGAAATDAVAEPFCAEAGAVSAVSAVFSTKEPFEEEWMVALPLLVAVVRISSDSCFLCWDLGFGFSDFLLRHWRNRIMEPAARGIPSTTLFRESSLVACCW